MVAGHTSHRVIELLLGSLAGIDMNEGIRSHHALVHAIEGQTAPVGAPEEPAIDPELILMHALPVDEGGRAIGRLAAYAALRRCLCQGWDVSRLHDLPRT